MDSRALAALLSSLVSQLTLLIILLYPSSPFSSLSSDSSKTLISLLHHFISSSEISSILAIPRKRRKTHVSDSDSDQGTVPGEAKLGPLGRVESVLVKDPDSFRVLFKMAPSTFEWLSGLLEPLLECRDPVDSPLNLSAELRLGIGLCRLSTGSGYPEVADRFRVTEGVAKFCSKQLCRVLCTNFRFWVGSPNSNEFNSVSHKFENLTGLPNCCGVIGCSRFKIIRTKKSDNLSSNPDQKEESIAAQIVVDSSSRILSIFAGSHGAKSNLRVLRSSTLYKDIEGGRLLMSPSIFIERVAIPQYLVGDSRYPLLPWLMIPFDDPKPGSSEEKFNAALRLMRVSMQKTMASLKSWGILSKPIEGEEFRNAVAYIGACAILHNALLLREDYSGLCDRVEDCIDHDQSSMHFRDTTKQSNMEGSWIEGSVIRSTLANKAKDLSTSK